MANKLSFLSVEGGCVFARGKMPNQSPEVKAVWPLATSPSWRSASQRQLIPLTAALFCPSSILANGKTRLINQVPSKGQIGKKKGQTVTLILCIDCLGYRGSPTRHPTPFNHNSTLSSSSVLLSLFEHQNTSVLLWTCKKYVVQLICGGEAM